MTEPYYSDATVTLHHGDCIEVMRELADCSVDAVVTDPPYGLGFMGKAWDDLPPGVDWARECLRVLKPGGHLIAFGGTRTWHRLVCAIEDAGFEIRDSIAWLYGSGFPKSLDVSKAIDKAAGVEREVVGTRPDFVAKFAAEARRGLSNQHGFNEAHDPGRGGYVNPHTVGQITAPATEAARQWSGWGTALKPAHEPIVVARKPLTGNVAGNVLQHGTGALNIDGCRIEGEAIRSALKADGTRSQRVGHEGWDRPWKHESQRDERCAVHSIARCTICLPSQQGRWPANVVLDSDSAELLDQQSGQSAGVAGGMRQIEGKVTFTVGEEINPKRFTRGAEDFGAASRFFYTSKADSTERPTHNGIAHPTVKPLDLMRWLVRLVTPPGGTVLEPFAGSGTTVEAALLEGFRCIAVEREADYLPLILQRIHRRRDPVAYLTNKGEDLGLFGEESA